MQDDYTEAAEAWLARFLEAWNNADLDAVRAELHYPHVTVGLAGQIVVAATPADFDANFDQMREREGWASSSFEDFTAISSSPTKVHFEVLFKRFHSDGTLYGSGRVLYIVTQQDDHWGMQLRSGIPDAALLAARG
jgi:hypothetical protein